MKNEKGLTLIELVVSVAVLAILIVPFFGIFTNAAKLDIRSKNDMTANYLAQQIVAEVKNNPGIFEEESDWTTENAIDLDDLFGQKYKNFSAQLNYEPITDLSVTQTIIEPSEYNASRPNATITIGFKENSDGETAKVFDYDYFDGVGGEFTDEDIVIGGNNDTEIQFKVNDTKLTIHFKSASETFDLDTPIIIPDPAEVFIIKIIWDTDSDDAKNNTKIELINKDTNYNVQFLTENFGTNSVGDVQYDVKINPGSGVEPYVPTISNPNTDLENIKQLSVSITGYDPIKKTDRVLEHFLTTVRQ